jgi:hypothetical protein
MPGPRCGPAYTRNSHADAHVIVAGAHEARCSRRATLPPASRFFRLGIVRIDRGGVLVWDSKEGSE